MLNSNINLWTAIIYKHYILPDLDSVETTTATATTSLPGPMPHPVSIYKHCITNAIPIYDHRMGSKFVIEYIL